MLLHLVSGVLLAVGYRSQVSVSYCLGLLLTWKFGKWCLSLFAPDPIPLPCAGSWFCAHLAAGAIDKCDNAAEHNAWRKGISWGVTGARLNNAWLFAGTSHFRCNWGCRWNVQQPQACHSTQRGFVLAGQSQQQQQQPRREHKSQVKREDVLCTSQNLGNVINYQTFQCILADNRAIKCDIMFICISFCAFNEKSY